MIQFLFNQALRSEHALDPNLTVLNSLRDHLGKPGTKEGCASGDCGACTVVVGELRTDDDGREHIRYRSLNSCLTFVSSLHGKQLISVEDLKHKGELHSVQKAMVECHKKILALQTLIQASTIAIASSTSTATRREHPGSCIVTPIN